MVSSPPTTGTLQANPLHQLLISALEHGRSGSLVFEGRDGKKSAVLLASGKPVKIKTAHSVMLLGSRCVERGFVARTALDEVLAQPRQIRLGEALIAAGLLDAQQLAEVLEEQFVRQIEWLSCLPEGTVFGFYAGQDYLARWGGPIAAPDPLAMIWRSLRAAEGAATSLRAALAPLTGRQLRLHPEARIARFEFDAKERAIVDLIRIKPHTLPELLALGLQPQPLVQRVVATLALTRHLDTGLDRPPVGVGAFSRPPQIEAVAPSPGVSRHPSVGPIANQSGSHRVVVDSESPSSSSQTLRLELEEEADRLSKVDFYELLGVAPDMPASAIQTAFLKSAKRWHPDRLDGGLSDLKPLASKVFSRMTEAHQVLTNASRRSEYDAALEDAGADSSEREQVQKVLRAANNFQKAQVLVKRSEWEEATKFAQLAQDDDPDQAEYVALAAWLAHRKLQGSAPEAYAPLLEKLARAEKKQPNNLRVRMYRADVLKAAGKVNEAVREYRFIAEADPNNVEAQRELRLYKMRANSPTSDAPGLFGRFFKKGQ